VRLEFGIPARSIERLRAPELCWVNAQVNTMRDVLKTLLKSERTRRCMRRRM
jgi:hypothetical protein